MNLPKELWICKEPTNGKWRVLTSKEEADNLFESYRPILYLTQPPVINWEKFWQAFDAMNCVTEEEAKIVLRDLIEKSIRGSEMKRREF